MSRASPKGQTTIGLKGRGLWCQPIKGRRRGGMGTHRASSHLRKEANLVGVNQELERSGGNDGGLGCTFGNIAATKECKLGRQVNQRRERCLGSKRNCTLAFGPLTGGSIQGDKRPGRSWQGEVPRRRREHPAGGASMQKRRLGPRRGTPSSFEVVAKQTSVRFSLEREEGKGARVRKLNVGGGLLTTPSLISTPRE